MAKTSRLLPLATALLSVLVGCDPPPTSIPPGQAPTMAPERSPERPPPPTRPPRPIEESVDAGAPATDPATPPASGGAVGAACTSAADCETGICEGEGCGAASSGVCVSRKRPCTADLRAYCGCDGVTFNASSSCPGRRYAARGECKR